MSQITEYRKTYGIVATRTLSEDEAKKYKGLEELPNDITRKKEEYGSDTYQQTIIRAKDHKERMEYLKYKELDMIKTIKGCVVFFTVLTVMSLVIGVVSFLIARS
ncbi:MAG: hypothetical protein FWE69_04415 [Clostridiales bacterium]|nr:hypothetical protein [Clostridiales bacterium]